MIAALSLYHLNQYDDAFRLLGAAKGREHLFAERADYFTVVALIAWATNHLAEMKEAIGQARRLAPNDPVVALNALGMYCELGDLDALSSVRQEVISGRYSGHPLTEFALAHAELAEGDYANGFRLLEVRYGDSQAHRHLNPALAGRPRWRGEDIGGKALLVSAEQGLGDTIMLARFLSCLPAMCARVAMEVQPEALSLLQYNFPGIDFLPRRIGKVPDVAFDVWVGSMSLPHLLGTTAETVPETAGYLEVPPESTEYWSSRVGELQPKRRPRIGLAWSGSPAHRSDRRRSIPFSLIADAIRGLEVDFFSLGDTKAPEIRPANLIDVSEELVTLSDTAALIAQLDLVITADTSSVHIAGAIGKETWLLLPYRYEWRWGLEGERNNWYDSVSVLRQTRGMDWGSVLAEAFGRRLRERFLN